MSDEILLGGNGRIDERGFLVRAVQYLVDTEAEAIVVGDATFMGVPQKRGGRSWVPIKSGQFKVTVIYEGLVEEPDESHETFEWLPSRSAEPIEAHPWINQLKKRYQGTPDSSGRVKFPPFLGDQGDGKDGLAGADGSAENRRRNPMFGWESYIKKGLTLRHRFSRRTFPYALVEQDGTVVPSVPGGYRTPNGRDWLLWVGNIPQRGAADTLGFDVTVDYVLSDRGGWPPMYWLIDNIS